MAIGGARPASSRRKLLRAAIKDMAQHGTLDRLYGLLHHTGDETAVAQTN